MLPSATCHGLHGKLLASRISLKSKFFEWGNCAQGAPASLSSKVIGNRFAYAKIWRPSPNTWLLCFVLELPMISPVFMISYALSHPESRQTEVEKVH